ncbi:hypothetical protein K503DRAFT_765861 [Rhizopogon vinicolor AM-OR11-026]|uniref:Uncharacterized protein n=1 Tax=Rhizopogon vinicolor AM-OR11-026 TaxID=1314800 RepID=A0A1B7NEY1_9AGAM|nr:hypothetical protein K503DRAFT_765861 [Rhizopogon vinicolor AM-OR11-026]
MHDAEREHAHNWLLAEDNRIFLFTFSSLALAVASLLLWRAKHGDNHPVNDRPDSQSAHSSQSVLTAALSTFHLASRAPGEYDMKVPERLSTPESSTSANTDEKPSRSKERRRRGKVPYKELLKGGKKTKPLLNAIKLPTHQDHDHSESLALETESKSMSSNDNLAPPTSPLPSPALDSPEENSLSHLNTESPLAGECHEERCQPPACMTASTSEPVSVSHQNTIMYHHSAMRPSRSEHACPPDTTHNTQPAESPCHLDDPAPSIPESSSSALAEDHDIHERASLSTSYHQSQPMPLYVSASTYASDLDGQSQAYTTSIRTNPKPPRFMFKQRGADNPNGNFAISSSISDNVFLTSSSHISPPRITPPSSASASSYSLHQDPGLNTGVPSSSSGSSPTLPHVTFPTLNPLQASANDHTHTHPSTIEGPTLSGKKATPPIQTTSRGSTPPPGASAHNGRTDSPAGPLSAQTQLASMRGALEAARLREEKARGEAECMGKENEELKWRWNEDVIAWRRRESELQAQIHHLMQQLQAAYSVLATFQTHAQAQAQSPAQPSSSFSSPTSPSPRLHPYGPNSSHNGPPQNLNYIPPTHVQALLASSYHPHSNFPGAYGGAAMSPLIFSGFGMPTSRASSVANGHAGGRTGHYTSDTSSSAGSSPSRGRRRRRSSKSSSGIHSEDISEAEEDQEDAWQNSILADAILKRPESLRMTSSRGSLRSDGRMSALGSVSSMSVKEGASRVPSRMSERSDVSASTSRSSYATSLSGSGSKGEDEIFGAIVEDGSGSSLPGITNGARADGQGTFDLDAPTQDVSSWDSIALAKTV